MQPATILGFILTSAVTFSSSSARTVVAHTRWSCWIEGHKHTTRAFRHDLTMSAKTIRQDQEASDLRQDFKNKRAVQRAGVLGACIAYKLATFAAVVSPSEAAERLVAQLA